jgi:RNA polymerase sigma factor (sigma-70 family)
MLDPSLRGFVDASDEDEADRRLGTLLETEAGPLIRRIAARKLSAHAGDAISRQDLDDVSADALLALVSRLRRLRADPAAEPIASFESYTATVAHNACAHYLRKKHPERSRLKSRIRYVLGRDRRFDLWETGDALVCGIAAWRKREASVAAMDALPQLGTDTGRWSRFTDALHAGRDDDPAPLIDALLRAAGGPVELDRLVGTIASLVLARDAEPAAMPPADALADRTAVPADRRLEQRAFTESLWQEVGLLPVRQRVALLLSLRDAAGSGLLWVFPLTGVAGVREIARTLEMPETVLAEVWNRLPLDDLEIGERLGCTRQQVINLRLSARKRLSNWLERDGETRSRKAPGANMRVVSDSLEGRT